ncbi:MAG TPA: histidine utilization repressor [Devosia sp.]|nr:histidine utilization repressor [Devosia sp.]
MPEAVAAPLHQRILGDIEQKIVSGQWPPGHRIPVEVELARQYGCSRMTVGRALGQLARSGLIERRRRSGSFVAQPVAQSAVLEIHDIRSEVEALGLAYAYRLLRRRRRTAGADDRRRLGIDRPVPLLELACCHFAGDRPFCLEHRLISLASVPDASDQGFENVAPGPWLLARVPWSAAEHTIRAIAADAKIGAILDLPRGAPCLAMERRTWSRGEAVTHVRFVYPGESHALVARFEPARSGA